MTMTTIKVSTDVRDRLNKIARAKGGTANSVVEQLLEEYLWNQRMETAIRLMTSMSEQERQEYMDEFHAWDSTLADGLEDNPWDSGQ